MKKKFMMSSVLGAVMALLLIFTFAICDKAEAKTTELKLLVYQGPMHIITQNTKRVASRMEKMTNGRVKIKVFDSGSLGKGESLQNVVQKGIVDIAVYNFAYGNEKNLPFSMLPNLPFLTKNIPAYTDMWQKDTTLVNMMNEYFAKSGYDNVMHFAPFLVGTQHMMLKGVQPKVPKDFSGVKIRTIGAVRSYFQMLGIKVVSLPVGDVYEALERGIVDGSTGAFSNVVDWKWGEATDYLLMASFFRCSSSFLVNKKSFAKLSPVDQNILETIFEWGRDAINAAYMRKDITGLNWAQKHMKKIYKPTDEEIAIWKKGAKPFIDRWLSLKGVGKRGKKALEIVEKFNSKY